MTEILKAVSLWQPWASLWLSRHKRHETRHWATRHRGLLLVHAAKKLVTDLDSDLAELLLDEFGSHWSTDLPRGALLGMIDLEDCVPTGKLHRDEPDNMTDEEVSDLVCGDFSDGRFGWRRGPGVLRFQRPVPWRGRQSLFDVPEDAIRFDIAAAVHVSLVP